MSGAVSPRAWRALRPPPAASAGAPAQCLDPIDSPGAPVTPPARLCATTTVFSPLEYGCVGYAEADAQEKFGAENISCYHVGFQPLEWQFNKYRPDGESCYVKIICNKQDNLRVIGYHLVAPSAGEITQGIAVAIISLPCWQLGSSGLSGHR